MDVKKVAAILAATAVMSTASLTVSHSLLIDNLLSVSAASYLRLEATGSSVTKLQQRLVALNYMKSDGVTGTFDATTDGAVKNLQNDYNMKVDGVVGPETTELIEGLVGGTAKVVKAEGAKVNIRAATNTKSEIIGTVNRDQKLKYDDYKTVAGVKWYHVSSGEMKGYMCGTYASVVKLSPVTVSNVGGSVSTGSSGTLKVTGTVLNVRSSASTSGKKLATLKRGEIYPYSSVKQVNGVNWYYVYVNSKTSGWVMGTFITRQGVPTAASGTLKVTGTFLNVRADATTSAQKIQEVKQGETYAYSEMRTVNGVNWYHIKLSDSLEGWVMGTFVIPVSSGTPSAVSESGSVKIKGNLLNVRAAASRTGKKLTQLHTGETYTYSETKTVDGEKWYYLRINDKISGWVIGQYVTATPNTAPSSETSATTSTDASSTQTTSTAATQTATSGTLKVTGGKVNVRSGPGTNYQSVGTAEKGKSYTYTDSKNGWYFIALSKYNSGWIIGDYVQATPDAAPTSTTSTESTTGSTESTTASTESTSSTTESSATGTSATSPTQTPSTSEEEPENGKLFVRPENALVNVREDAGLTYKVVEQVSPGTVYTYTKVKNGWFFIKVSDTVSGWIMGDFIEATPDETTTSATTTTSSVSTTTDATSSTATATTTVAPPVDDKDETGTLIVMDDDADIYTDSNGDSTVVAQADKGQKLTYHGVRDGWFFVRVSNTLSGWIMGQSVEATPDAVQTTTTTVTSATASTQAPSGTDGSSADPSGTTTSSSSPYTPASDSGTETGKLEVNTERLRVRTGAGTNYEIITQVSRGQILQYKGVKDGWYCIVIDPSLDGWVMGDYVKATPDTTTSASSATTDASQTGASQTDASQTETSGTDASTTASTTSTTAGEESTTEEPTTTTTAANVGREVLVGTIKVNGSLNVRKGAGTKYASLGTIKNGSTVVIAARGTSWHKIEYNGGYGYVSVDYVKDIKKTYESQMLVYLTSYNYVDVGNKLDLGLTVGSGAVTYTSSDAMGCPISNEGVVIGKNPGLYTITAKSGMAQASTCVVVLKEPNKDIAPMTISEAGTKFIAEWEGGGTVLPTEEIVFYPYQDVSKFWTLGYGHAMTTTASKSWSEERAVAEFNADIERMIGKEHILTDEKPYLTLEEATALLNADLKDGPYAKAVSDWAVRNGVKLSQTQFDALVSFCYNLGASMWDSDATKFYLKSSILAYRNGSDAKADQVIEGFCRYMKSSGKNYKGLWYRRRNEAELFLEGDYTLDRDNKFKLPSNVVWA